ncbi:hypothetical protein C4K13_2209 [Pseudomonas chlororaphis subsp. aureofaciens]|nr:hypothetical protein C4K13_2209 [Pseudomonas chlororaphis subsp. aureofaciens]AZD98114.1 hypothetical protein C4K12_2248 [Pseudomonas chlororaphis subsp. aureofaciens]AZE22678.1 hypothetical protein C4K08_2251 [Pseudomonas chlororaphis subsp. aureofaciens]
MGEAGCFVSACCRSGLAKHPVAIALLWLLERASISRSG